MHRNAPFGERHILVLVGQEEYDVESVAAEHVGVYSTGCPPSLDSSYAFGRE